MLMKSAEVLLIFLLNNCPKICCDKVTFSKNKVLIDGGHEIFRTEAPAWSCSFIFYDWLRDFDDHVKGVRLCFSGEVPFEFLEIIPEACRKIEGGKISILFSEDASFDLDSDDQILAGGNEFFFGNIFEENSLAVKLLLPA